MNRDEAIEKVLRNLNYRGNPENTANTYSHALKVFFDFIDMDDVSQVTVDDCMDHIICLKNSGRFKDSTLNVKLAAYRYFFDVVLNRPPSRRQLPSLITEVTEPKIFSYDQIQFLLYHSSLKMKTMIMLGFDCGLRVSEVAKLRCKDIDSENMMIYIHNSKRRKSRKVRLSPAVLSLLREYWIAYQPGQSYLFPGSSEDGHLNPNSINYAFRKLLTSCNLDHQGYRFHSLRHTYATTLLKLGCSPFLLKKLLGHKSFSSTARYIKMNDADIMESFSISERMDFKL